MSTFVRWHTSSLPVQLWQKLCASRLPFSRHSELFVENPEMSYPPCIWLHRGGDLTGISASLWRRKNGYPGLPRGCLRDDMSGHFDRTSACHWQTDGRTQGHNVHRASIASRGKNWLFNSRMFEHLQYPVYTIQPVVKPVWQPVWQRVWQPVVSCIQTFNRLSNRFDERIDNRLYRVNGA